MFDRSIDRLTDTLTSLLFCFWDVVFFVSIVDVANFGTEDRYHFLDNTWSLLPESNISLRSQYLYTISEYHEAVFKMNGFFTHFLTDANVIFASFRGVPSKERVDYLTSQASNNLSLGKKYVGAKLLSASVLAAFATLTGGDAPISLFMGDLPSRQHGESQQIDDYLPNPKTLLSTQRGKSPSSTASKLDKDDVFQILALGRRSDSSFDIKASPLAAFLYAACYSRVGGEEGENEEEDGLSSIINEPNMKQYMSYPMTKDHATKLLQSLPQDAIEVIGICIGQLAISRKAAIHDLLTALTFDIVSPAKAAVAASSTRTPMM